MKRATIAAAIFIGGMLAGALLDDGLETETCHDAGGAWDDERDTCRYE